MEKSVIHSDLLKAFTVLWTKSFKFLPFFSFSFFLFSFPFSVSFFLVSSCKVTDLKHYFSNLTVPARTAVAKAGAGGVAQGQSACITCTRS